MLPHMEVGACEALIVAASGRDSLLVLQRSSPDFFLLNDLYLSHPVRMTL
jgi:hypothetical protein